MGWSSSFGYSHQSLLPALWGSRATGHNSPWGGALLSSIVPDLCSLTQRAQIQRLWVSCTTCSQGPLLFAFQAWKFPGSKDGLMESRAAFLSYEDLPSLTDGEKGRGVCAPALHCPPAPLCLGSSTELCKTLGGTGSIKCCWGDRWAQRTDSYQSCLLQALSTGHDRPNNPCSCPGWIISASLP